MVDQPADRHMPEMTFYIPGAGLTIWQWDTAFLIFILRDCSVPVATRYIEQAGGSCSRVLTSALEDRFLHADPTSLAAYSAGHGDLAAAPAAATQWLVEYDLFAWVDEMNRAAGLAPTPHPGHYSARLPGWASRADPSRPGRRCAD